MLNVDNQKNKIFIQQTDKNKEVSNTINNKFEVIINPYKEDNKNIEINSKKSGSAPTIITFDMDNKEITSLINKLMNNEISNEDIQKLISDMNDNTIKAILDAMDKMIENARKMMEQNKIYYEKVERPRLENLKKILQQELIKREEQIKNNR